MSQVKRVSVVGGSLGGLFVAVGLREAGFEVTVFEQSAGSMESRGGGIVVQADLIRFFEQFSPGSPELPQTRCAGRRFFHPGGAAPSDTIAPQNFTSWDVIFRKLKGLYHDGDYRARRRVVGYHSDPDFARITLDDGEAVDSDLVIFTDGAGSPARRHFLPGQVNHYAGYLAWRGYVDETTLLREVLEQIDDRFCFYDLPDGHILCYPIPGADGKVNPGERRFNWVWYIDADEAKKQAMLVDKNGTAKEVSVAPGKTAPAVIEALHAKAATDLPAALQSLVAQTPEPFLQAITDVNPTKGVFGRNCLMGDAAFVVRPHTAAATAKVAAEAMKLTELLQQHPDDVSTALAQYDAFQQMLGKHLFRQGVSLGNR